MSSNFAQNVNKEGVLFNEKEVGNENDDHIAQPGSNPAPPSPFGANSPTPARFQELAMMLIGSLKGLMVFTHGKEDIKGIKDKEVETRVRTIRDIL
jgi:hypothetical protein